MIEQLSRDELESILAYEVSRIDSYDIALSSWTVALTGGAIAALDGDDNGLASILGWLPNRLAQRLQIWALRDLASGRDRCAISFTKNPASLVRALEKLDADRTQLLRVSRATAPLWVEFPERAAGNSKAGRKLLLELGLDRRIVELRRLAHLGEGSGERGAQPSGGVR
jgi:Zn-dependent protease with chaperone function